MGCKALSLPELPLRTQALTLMAQGTQRLPLENSSALCAWLSVAIGSIVHLRNSGSLGVCYH